MSLKCYYCDDCGFSKGEEKTCSTEFDQCFKVEYKVDIERIISRDCESCYLYNKSCDATKDCSMGCCDSDLCNVGAVPSFSVLVVSLCSLVAVVPFFKWRCGRRNSSASLCFSVHVAWFWKWYIQFFSPSQWGHFIFLELTKIHRVAWSGEHSKRNVNLKIMSQNTNTNTEHRNPEDFAIVWKNPRQVSRKIPRPSDRVCKYRLCDTWGYAESRILRTLWSLSLSLERMCISGQREPVRVLLPRSFRWFATKNTICQPACVEGVD